MPPDEPKIATYHAKWDEEYRKRWGLQNQFAEELDPRLVRRIEQTCKRIYRLLTIDGYARLDLRLTPENEIYFIEANPNPSSPPTKTSRNPPSRPECPIRNSSRRSCTGYENGAGCSLTSRDGKRTGSQSSCRLESSATCFKVASGVSRI